MADELREAFAVEPELIPGSGGVFKVRVDGEVIYAKSKFKEFPEKGEVVAKLKEQN